MSQNLPLIGFISIEETSQFNDEFDKTSIMVIVMKIMFFEVVAQYPKNVCSLNNYLPFLSEKMKIKNVEKFVKNLDDKKRICYTYKTFKSSINS